MIITEEMFDDLISHMEYKLFKLTGRWAKIELGGQFKEINYGDLQHDMTLHKDLQAGMLKSNLLINPRSVRLDFHMIQEENDE